MTPLFKKLNLKEDLSIHCVNAPDSFQSELSAVNNMGIDVKTEIKDPVIQFVLYFVHQKSEIKNAIDRLDPLLKDDALLWFAYPKKSSIQYVSDISRDDGWQPVGLKGWEGVRQIAIDGDWSALRFRRVQYIKNITRRSSMAMTPEAKGRTTQK
jgi:hypothetical protein